MIEINRKTLANGLRIVHSEDTNTQMVALNILYNVGARDEHPEHTGFAHLFEHLMFGGSVNIPDYDAYVQSAGGENNAWTNNDITNYYITLPRQNVEIGFWLESDRMLSLDFNERSLEVQRNVVIEEFKQRNLNQPYGDVGHLVRGLVYQKHPYQWPTIGKEPSHIENATLDEVKDFFFRFYAPNNAILAVTGNISFEDTVALAEKWFGPIPCRNVQPRNLPIESAQTEERRLTVERNVPVDALHMVFHKCDRLHPDYHVYDMMSDLLSAGRSSRLIQHLVIERQVFGSVDAYISGSIDAGMFYVVGKLAPGITLEEAEAAVWCCKNQWLAPYADGSFRPDAPAKREEVADLLYRFVGMPVVQTDILANYKDRNLVTKADAISWAIENEILLPKDGKIDPEASVTMAEFAHMLVYFTK